MNRGTDALSASRRRGGFSLAETLVVMAVLALCADLICNTMAFGVRCLEKRIRYSQAVVLLDTLCAAVRNDLEYAAKCYADGSIERLVRDYAAAKDYGVRTWYGVGQWSAENPDSYFDETVIQWRGIQDSDASPGQIIRKSALSDGQYFFDCVCPPENYADGLCADMEIAPGFVGDSGEGDNKIDRFVVTVTICDGPEVAAARDFGVRLVQPIPVIEEQ